MGKIFQIYRIKKNEKYQRITNKLIADCSRMLRDICYYFSFILLAIFFSCSEDSQEKDATNVSSLMVGSWNAQWKTLPESFPEVKDMDFTMNGEFNFIKENTVAIKAYGYPGCIFSSDTLSHSLNWKILNDTLKLLNQGEKQGITYKIKSFEDSKIELQLMEDIFVTLTK